MGNIIELSKLVKATLNTNIADPFPTGNTRIGPQFYIESDEINLSRRDTFPKGYIQPSPTDSPNKKGNFGRTGWITKYATLDIFYYVKENNSYTTNGITYKNQDFVSYMLNEIETVLLTHGYTDYHLAEDAFGVKTQPRLATEGSFKLYFGILPITFYWAESYGT